jgi:hypothetical protein
MLFKQSPMFGLTKFDTGFAVPDSGPKSAGFGCCFYAIFMLYATAVGGRNRMQDDFFDYTIF